MLDATDFYEFARTPPAIALTTIIAVVYPLVSWWRYRTIGRDPAPWPRARKLRVYATTIAVQWLLVLAIAALLQSEGGGLADIGQRFTATAPTLVFTIMLVAWFVVVMTISTRRLSAMKSHEIPPHVARTGPLLPIDRTEAIGYVALAITVGICEEILYRGWLPKMLGAWLGGDAIGFVVSAVVFGLAHAYQGRNGMLLSGLLGLLFGMMAWWTGSIIPGQLVHVGIDLVTGFAIARALRRLRQASIAAPGAASVVESEP